MIERQRICAVGKRLGGIVVRLQKDSVNACRDAGARKRLDEFRLTAACMALTAGKLDGVRNVKDHRVSVFFQNGEGAKIDNQILISKRSSALG